MFAKLIKYNLKPIFKSVLPFLILFTASIILFNLTAYDVEYLLDNQHNVINMVTPSEIQQFLHGIADFMIGCSLLLIIAATIRAIWQRFNTSFYSDEAYLTHTLPIPRRTIWNAQICSILIAFISIIIYIIPNILLLTLTRDGQQLLESLGLVGGCTHCFGEYFSIHPLKFSFYLSYAFIVFVELLFLTFCGITGLIIKHHFSKNIALVSGVAIYLLGGAILLGILHLISRFDPDIFSMFNGIPTATPGSTFDYSFMARTLLYISGIYSCYSIALYFVDQHLLRRGINLT